LFCSCAVTFGQIRDTNLLRSNIRFKTIAVPLSDTLRIDSFSLDKGSFHIGEVPDTSFKLYPEASYLVWKHRPIQDSLHLQYRVLPFLFTAKKAHKGLNLVEKNLPILDYTYSLGDTSVRGFVDFNSIEYNGTYGRSLSIGNSQDLSLNSNFNLQMNGYILDSVRIEAAITDNNIPIQPDGNTQQIQEFDRIYITFQKGNHKLTAGDYNLERPNSYFINFTKRVQGLFYQDDFAINKKITNKIGLSASIAKGQFARNIFQGSEGNQGPYKLTGNNGEQFFIVLAGTEKVYIDGVLMTRGEDKDYVINYNTGEITFMPRQLITQDKRIQFEFEYQDRNYLNTLVYGYDELQIGKKWNIRLNAYSNQDSKNQPYSQSLSGEQKRFLEGIGDNIDQAYYEEIKVDTFAANKILYKMVDTIVNSVFYDSVFVYSANPDSAIYSLGFSYVGTGKGNYIIASSNTNGRSYSWIAPADGVSQGDYAPVVLLITPKKQQLFTIGSTYQIDSFKKVSVELGASNYAPNLFSDRDKDLHWGFSGRGIYEEQRFFGKKDTFGRKPLTWKNQLSYEYVQSKFKAIAPYRNVEFSRDWNVPVDAAPADENLIIYNTELNKNKWGGVAYNLTSYKRGSDYTANRNIITLSYDHNDVKGNVVFNLMNASNTLQTSAYFRPSAYLEKRFRKLLDLTLGAKYQKEHDEIRYAVTDTLMPTAFAFDIYNFYVRNSGNSKTSVEVNYTIRDNFGVLNNAFAKQNTGHTIDAKIGLNQFKGQQITITGAYRKLLNHYQIGTQQKEDQSVLGRIEYNGTIAKGFMVPSLLYEIGSGQEQKRIYTYVEVPAGQGIYMWNDYNNDGVQQSNEFEIALYPDQKKFIRIITPTNEYQKVNYVTLNQSLNVNPENLWMKREKKKGWQTFVSRFSDQLSLQINNRVLSDAGFQAFNPFATKFADTSIIANLTSISNTFFFNRNSAFWGAEYTVASNSGKSLLTYGVEGNKQWRQAVKFRWTLLKALTGNLGFQNGTKGYNSALDDGRTYNIQLNNVEPSLTWIARSSVRITGSYKWDRRQNEMQYGGEKAMIQSLNFDARITKPSLGTIQARGTYANINYNGAANTSLSFVILDALQVGSNWLWYINWERRLSKGIELSLEYEGRKPGDNPVVHTGRMSIRAIL
jgi:hypothetical protein